MTRWTAHLLVKAPRGAAMELHVNNGPMGLFHVDGSLKVRAVNGPITVRGCKGDLDLSAENGPVSLEENGGKQSVRTQNGPITIDLDGKNWSGAGLEAHATNGPVTLRVPADTSQAWCWSRMAMGRSAAEQACATKDARLGMKNTSAWNSARGRLSSTFRP